MVGASWIVALGVAVVQPALGPAWATECPPRAEVQALVEARLGRAVSTELERIGARGGLEDTGVWIELVFAGDGAERTRRISAASCGDILQPTALVIALAIDSEATARAEARAAAASSDPFDDAPVPAEPPIETPVVPAVARPLEPASIEPSRSRTTAARAASRAATMRTGIREAFVGLELGTDLVLLRRTGFGGQFTTGMWLGFVRLAAQGSFWVPRRVRDPGFDTTLRAGTVGVGVCVAPAVGPVQLGACADLEAGTARAGATAAEPARREAIVTATLGPGVWWSVGRIVALVLRAGGIVVARRPRFGDGDTVANRDGRFAAKITAGVEVRFDTRRRRSAGN